MKTQAQFRALSKTGLGALTLIMSLALLLGPAQTSFAKNTPTPAVDHSGTTGGGGGDVAEAGVIDGGPGAGDVERIVAELDGSKNANKNPTAYKYDGGKTARGGGSTGVIPISWGPLDSYYYYIFIELLIMDMFPEWNSTLIPTAPTYEN